MHSFPAGAVPIVPKNGRSGTSTLPILLLGMSSVAALRLLSRCQTNSRSGTGGVTIAVASCWVILAPQSRQTSMT